METSMKIMGVSMVAAGKGHAPYGLRRILRAASRAVSCGPRRAIKALAFSLGSLRSPTGKGHAP
jgi:hypothetical protein